MFNSFMVLNLAILSTLVAELSLGQLQVGFYSDSCPNAEAIVASVVREAAISDATVPAALLRLHYHDCIVQGCDGSVLITDPNNESPENRSPNHAGLRGFDVIERAKTQLEDKCEGVVSCADIVALAARDAIVMSQGPFYQVPTGRRDGRVSNVSDAEDMPELQDSVAELKAKFQEKGLSEKDLVLLSAAHTIGTTACFFLERRLYDFFPGGGSDPSINPVFLPELQARCPRGGDVNVRAPLDRGSERRFDKQIFANIRTGFAVIESDAKLYADESTKEVVDSYFGLSSSVFGPFFEADFAGAMVRMGMVGVKMGDEGEIRRVCSQFN